MPTVLLDPVIQELKPQIPPSCIQPLIPAGTQLQPLLATACCYSYSDLWKYIFSCLWLYHFILLRFYLLLSLPFLKGREHLNAWTIGFVGQKPPSLLSGSHRNLLSTAANYTQTFCYSLIPHLLPSSLQSVVNSQHFIEASLRKVTDDLCTLHSIECTSPPPPLLTSVIVDSCQSQPDLNCWC